MTKAQIERRDNEIRFKFLALLIGARAAEFQMAQEILASKAARRGGN